MTAFETGQVVRLKSGGPLMTVDTVQGATLTCKWFIETELHTESFLCEQVELAHDDIKYPPPGEKQTWDEALETSGLSEAQKRELKKL